MYIYLHSPMIRTYINIHILFLSRWNNLVKRMASSLADLQKALVGEIGMSDDLDALGESVSSHLTLPIRNYLIHTIPNILP